MLRKLSAIQITLAMVLVMATFLVPHHHHKTGICLSSVSCDDVSCCGDEQEHEASGNEGRCVARESFIASGNLMLDGPQVRFILPFTIPPEGYVHCEVLPLLKRSQKVIMSGLPLPDSVISEAGRRRGPPCA